MGGLNDQENYKLCIFVSLCLVKGKPKTKSCNVIKF